jgi:hypothetical protein
MQAQAADPRNGPVIAACGGTEQPFTVNGRRWLYVYQPSSHRHGYLNLDTDITEWHRSFHPAFAPQFEGVEEEEIVPVKTVTNHIPKPARPARLVWG